MATVAAAAHDGRLLVVDVASGQVTELAASDDGVVDGLAWSPDSAWLAWAQPGPQPLRRIRMARIADLAIIDVTDGRFADTDPVFTLDGRHLAFLSQRSFDPVYDTQSFDMSFPYGSRPFLVPLAAVGTIAIALRPVWRRVYGPLVVAIATVKTHVASILAKLGIRGRGQLAKAFLETESELVGT